jgi:general secretion pathway protein G
MHELSPRRLRTGFTLVEILIVVVILGILAAIVVPQFSSATSDAQRSAVQDQVNKVRKAIAIYYVRSGNVYPNIVPGPGATSWGEIGPGTSYMRTPPANPWVGGPNATVIIHGTGPDAAYQTTHGWIFDPATGQVWAGSCDDDDVPLPRP